MMAERPLFVNIDVGLHQWLDTVREQTGLSKADIVRIILTKSRKELTARQIVDLFDEYVGLIKE